MRTREDALAYALSFAETYRDAPFRDQNWQLVRVRKTKKVFLWTYEKEGNIWLNVKVNPEMHFIKIRIRSIFLVFELLIARESLPENLPSVAKADRPGCWKKMEFMLKMDE